MAYEKYLIILSVAVILVAIVLPEGFLLKLWVTNKPTTKNKGVYLQDQLANFNGVIRKKLYLAVMGSIFDVTEGKSHYSKGSSYNYFVGKDGSRALVTGNFNDDSEDKDHVLDLPCSDLIILLNWKEIFKQKYKPVGVVVGRYYDESGQETPYTKQLNARLEECHVESELQRKENLKYPPCNAAWEVDSGTRVWCTKASGGIKRDWVGVPRQFYKPGDEAPYCVCVDSKDGNTGTMFKEYENCPQTSTSCVID